MSKTLKRVLAVVLAMCSILSYTLPAANASWWEDLFGGGGSTDTVVTYNFNLYSDYSDVPTVLDAYNKEQKYVFHQALLGKGATASIPSRYADESDDLNWTFEACSEGIAYGSGEAANLPNAYSRFASAYGLRSVVTEGEWIAFRFQNPGEGAHYLNLTYYSWASSPNTCAFYIFEADGEASIANEDVIVRQQTIEASLHPTNRLGTLKMNSGASGAEMSAVIGNYTFAADKEYVLVIENIEASTTSGSAYVALEKLEIAPGEAESDSETTSNDIRPIVAQENAVPATDNGGMAAVWKVDGQDYYFLPLEGSKMAIFNLDTWEHVDTVDTGLYYPTSTTVTKDGKLIVGGDSRWLYIFDINTMRGKKTADFRTASGFENESMVHTVHAADDGYIYFGTSFGGRMARYDIVNQEFKAFDDIIDPAVRKAYGITTDSTDKGDTEGNVKGIAVHNGYLYAKASSANYVIIVKYDLANEQLIGAIDVTDQLGSVKTQGGLFVLGNEYLVGTGSGDATMALIELENFTLVEKYDTNYKALFQTTAAQEAWTNGIEGIVTEEVNGKQFFFVNNGGLFYYELGTNPQIKRLRQGVSGKFNITGNPTVTMTLDGDTAETEYLIAFASGGEPRFFNPSVGAKLSKAEKLMSAEYAGGGSAIGVHELNGTNIYIGAWNNYAAAVYDTSLEKITQRYITAGQTDSQLYYEGQLYAGNYSATVVTKVDMDAEEQTEFVIQDIKKYQQQRIHTLAAGNDHIFCGTIPYYTEWGGAVAAYDINNDEQSLLSFRCVAVSDEKTIGCTYATTGTHHPLCNLAVNGIVYEETNDVIIGATTRNGGTSVGYSDGTSAQIFVLDYENMEILATLDLRNTDLGLQTDVIDYIGGLTIDPNVPGRVWGIVSDVLFYFTYDKTAKTFAVTKVLDLGSSSYPTSGNVGLHNREVVFDTDNNKMYVAFFSNGMQCITVDDWDTPTVVSNEKFLPETPESYVLSTDKAGKTSLYYESGNDLMAYPVNVDDTDWAIAAGVDAQIEAIGDVTAEKVDDIAAARAAYEALSLRHRALVQKYLTLTESEALVLEMQITDMIAQPTINDLSAMSDLMVKYNDMTDTQKSYVRNYEDLLTTYDNVLYYEQNTDAGVVQDQINELTDITLKDEETVIAVRAAYEALTDEQKAVVDTTNLEAAEAQLEALSGAKDVQALIDALPDSVTSDNAQQVEAARAAYEALSDALKSQVDTTKLETAEKQLLDIAAADEVQVQIDALPATVTSADAQTVADARAAYDALSDFAKTFVDDAKLLAAEKQLEDLEKVSAVQETINALPDEIVITDINVIKAARAAYDALSEAAKAEVNTEKLLAAEEALEKVKKNTAPTKQVYDFELYNNPDFYTDCTKFTHDTTNGITSNFYASSGYNSTYATVADWFYGSYPQTINWGVETNNSGKMASYIFRGASDQGMRLDDTTTVGTYSTLRIFVPAAGLYQVDLTAGNYKTTFSMYVIPASTFYAAERTSLDTITEAMANPENQLLGKTVLAADAATTAETAGQWNVEEPGDYILIFYADAANGKGINFRNMTLTPVVNAETAVATVGENYFISLDEALAYQVETGAAYVSLNKDVELGDLVLESKEVLNLNGHTLTVDTVYSVASGGIVDHSEKDTGVLKVLDTEEGMMLDSGNCQLPVYDAAEEGYRFFKVTVNAVTVTGKKSGTPKYWFKLDIENDEELCALIQTGKELSIKAKLICDGTSVDATATAEFVTQWAGKFAENQSIYITVSVDNTVGYENISLTPYLTANGVDISGEEMK